MIQIRDDITSCPSFSSCLSSNHQFSFLLSLDKGMKEENYNNSFERALLQNRETVNRYDPVSLSHDPEICHIDDLVVENRGIFKCTAGRLYHRDLNFLIAMKLEEHERLNDN